MTAWIVLLALVVLFTLAVRHGRPADPPLPTGYDGELDEEQSNQQTRFLTTSPQALTRFLTMQGAA